MELLQLKYFKDAAELENFSKAAKKNMVPQPSISYAIKKLEDELGVLLFDRNGRKIFLNENGEYVYQKVSSILNTVDECTAYFANTNVEDIKLYIQDGDFFISHLSADFMSAYPNAHFVYATVEEVLHSDNPPYDFTFMLPICDMKDFNYELLLKDEFVLLVSKDNPLSKYNEIELSMIKDEPFVGLYDTIPVRVVTDTICKAAGFTPNYVFKTHEDFATTYKVSQNAGISIMPYKYYMIHPDSNIKVIN